MLRTHLKFFIRVFLKDKFFSVLNILGLALGIAVSIILLLILQHDLTYDKHFANHERIFRVGGHLKATGVEFRGARSARELGEILKEEFPEIQTFTRANAWDHVLVKYERNGEDIAYYEEDVVRADSTYFQVFKSDFIAGDPQTCLDLLNSVVISESTAKRYFGDENALNKSLFIGEELWRVTAVIKDLPANTHLKFDILLSGLPRTRPWTLEEGGQIRSEAFWNPDVYLYVLMPENYDPQNFYAKFPSIFDKYYKSFGDKVGGTYAAILQPLADIHFHSDLEGDEPLGNIAYLYAFTAIGIFIMLLACINYMNLSTAKSAKRATEIAMKKTLGSGRVSLIVSFLGESVFLSFMSMLVAFAIVQVVVNMSSFNELIGRKLTADFVNNPLLIFGSLAITIGIGLLSGLYPAFHLPSIPTIKALKGTFKSGSSGQALRKVLTTLQFSISIFVVVCTLFMQDQIDFMRNQDLGFNKENILVLPIQDTLVQNQITAIKHELLQNPRISSATTSYNVMGMGAGGPVMWAEGEDGMKQQSFSMISVGDDYFKTMGIQIVAGRDFEPGTNGDVENIFICNEATAKLMNWGDDPVGKKVKWFHGETEGRIIGMVKDFNYSSLHNKIEPLLIIKRPEEGGFLHLKVSSENLPETMDYVKRKWTGYDPNHPFEYFFLDQRFNEQYKADEIQYKLLSNLSYICIFISLLGLLGLSAFTAAQRTKEIGIRKVHGASIPRIIYLLYKDVMYLVIFAAILVIAPAYYVIDYWMANFAYQTALDYSTFIWVAVMALVFAFLTVAFHSWKTARTNPVDSLKYE
ncbi:ABC transporter permease [Chryseolinea sp. H1M3-3]|uniref:ABC transporter permease n=1 Tax=Chryseolinea sp. H1M3-3 TaxID=3034144 RepID=UPI0023EBDB13|nr:ABC transporter permease [Chryseolinea sp. H1M3-3]